QQDGAHFRTKRFEYALQVRGLVAVFHGESHVADVDQVKANEQQMIERIGQSFVAVKAVYEEDAPAFVQGLRNPDGERDTNGEIGEVGPDGGIHVVVSFLFVRLVVSGYIESMLQKKRSEEHTSEL